MKLVETSTEASSGFRVLEAAHRFVSSLDPAMTLLDLNFRGFASSSSIIPRVSPCTALYSRGKGALDMAGYANRTISIDAVSGFIRGQPAPIRTEPMTPATWSDQQPWQEWKASHDPHRPAISGPNPRRTSGLGEWGAGARRHRASNVQAAGGCARPHLRHGARPAKAAAMAYPDDTGELCSIGTKLPYTQDDWRARRAAVDAVLDDDGGIVTRVGEETVGEMWSLSDGQNVLNEANPRFSENIRRHVERVVREDPFHVSAGLSDRVQPGAKRA
jgi:hypothetical protein